jgi:hypothetical protein
MPSNVYPELTLRFRPAVDYSSLVTANGSYQDALDRLLEFLPDDQPTYGMLRSCVSVAAKWQGSPVTYLAAEGVQPRTYTPTYTRFTLTGPGLSDSAAIYVATLPPPGGKHWCVSHRNEVFCPDKVVALDPVRPDMPVLSSRDLSTPREGDMLDALKAYCLTQA